MNYLQFYNMKEQPEGEIFSKIDVNPQGRNLQRGLDIDGSTLLKNECKHEKLDIFASGEGLLMILSECGVIPSGLINLRISNMKNQGYNRT